MHNSVKVRTQDLKVLLRAQEVISRLSATESVALPSLEPVISLARQSLQIQKGRRRYLQEMLPTSVAHALPGISGRFVAHMPGTGEADLSDHTLPVLAQILRLEERNAEQLIRLSHSLGGGLQDRQYWL